MAKQHAESPTLIRVTRIEDFKELDWSGLSHSFLAFLRNFKPLEEFYSGGGSAHTPLWILDSLLEKHCQTKRDKAFVRDVVMAYRELQFNRTIVLWMLKIFPQNEVGNEMNEENLLETR